MEPSINPESKMTKVTTVLFNDLLTDLSERLEVDLPADLHILVREASEAIAYIFITMGMEDKILNDPVDNFVGQDDPVAVDSDLTVMNKSINELLAKKQTLLEKLANPVEEGVEPKVNLLAKGFLFTAQDAQIGEHPFWMDVQLTNPNEFLVSGSSNAKMTRNEVKALRKALKKVLKMEDSHYGLPDMNNEDEKELIKSSFDAAVQLNDEVEVPKKFKAKKKQQLEEKLTNDEKDIIAAAEVMKMAKGLSPTKTSFKEFEYHGR